MAARAPAETTGAKKNRNLANRDQGSETESETPDARFQKERLPNRENPGAHGPRPNRLETPKALKAAPIQAGKRPNRRRILQSRKA